MTQQRTRSRISIVQRIASCVLLVGLTLPATAPVRSQDVGGRSGLYGKQNLDLPFDATPWQDSGEDAPEIIVLYNQRFEGDAFFFVVDRSSTMQSHGELARAKRELTRIIRELSPRTEFGVVFFDKDVIRFPSSGRPTRATPPTRAVATAWIQAVRGGLGTCSSEAIVAALQQARRCESARKVLCYIGDGGGTCPPYEITQSEYLQRARLDIRNARPANTQINAIAVLIGHNRPEQESFLRDMVLEAGGTYRKIN